MIEVIFKHHIYETAINIIFDKIIKNFNTNNIIPKEGTNIEITFYDKKFKQNILLRQRGRPGQCTRLDRNNRVLQEAQRQDNNRIEHQWWFKNDRMVEEIGTHPPRTFRLLCLQYRWS